MVRHPTLDEWIAQDAIHFDLDDAASFDAAVDLVVGLLECRMKAIVVRVFGVP